MVIYFAGIDLAWTPHRESGVCIFGRDGDGVHLIELCARIDSPQGFADRLAELGDDVVAAIDAPLLVGPGRTVEAAIGREFGRFQASAHSASEKALKDRMAGPNLAAELRARGFSLDPGVALAMSPARVAIEVYPHTAHVVLFGLASRIPYKRKKGRRSADLRLAMRRLQSYLYEQIQGRAPGLLKDSQIVGVLAAEALEARGAAFKRLEDMLDAITCALMAMHVRDWGWARSWVVCGAGCSWEDGYIVTPRMPAWDLPERFTFAPGRSSP